MQLSNNFWWNSHIKVRLTIVGGYIIWEKSNKNPSTVLINRAGSKIMIPVLLNRQVGGLSSAGCIHKCSFLALNPFALGLCMLTQASGFVG